MENTAGILIFTVIVIGFAAVFGLIAFIAYRYIRKRFGRYTDVPGQAEREPADTLTLRSKQRQKKYMDAAQAQRLKMKEWLRQAEEAGRQKAQENGKRIIDDIKTSARREIGRELDDAVGEIQRECDGLTASGNEVV